MQQPDTAAGGGVTALALRCVAGGAGVAISSPPLPKEQPPVGCHPTGGPGVHPRPHHVRQPRAWLPCHCSPGRGCSCHRSAQGVSWAVKSCQKRNLSSLPPQGCLPRVLGADAAAHEPGGGRSQLELGRWRQHPGFPGGRGPACPSLGSGRGRSWLECQQPLGSGLPRQSAQRGHSAAGALVRPLCLAWWVLGAVEGGATWRACQVVS